METIGGYQIIRKLGAGSRAEVYLGHADRGVAGKPELVALKVFRDGASEVSVSAEITILSTVRQSHIVQLIDLTSTAQGHPVLILQRLSPSGLGRLLADRERMDAGEAVTILAPLSEALSAMHSQGFSHGGIGAANILFDEFGAPVFVGFGAAGIIGGPDREGRHVVSAAEREADAGVHADLRGLSLLAAAVLSRVPSDLAVDSVREWVNDYSTRPLDADFSEQLGARLFAMAAPEPVRSADRAAPTDSSAGDAVVAVRGAFTSKGGRSTTGGPRARRPARRRHPSALTRFATEPLRMGARSAAGFLKSAIAPLREVRRRVWVLAAAGFLALLGAGVLAIFASSHSSTMESATPPNENTSSSAEGLSTDLATEKLNPDVEAVMGNDPVVALELLLELRGRCLDDRSVLCLDSVNQPDSAAWAADAALIHGLQEGAEFQSRLGTGMPVLLERLGDSALLTVPLGSSAADAGDAVQESATASVLLIRTEAGWRIRSVLDALE